MKYRSLVTAKPRFGTSERISQVAESSQLIIQYFEHSNENFKK